MARKEKEMKMVEAWEGRWSGRTGRRMSRREIKARKKLSNRKKED